MNYAIVYYSKYGQTKKIADHLKESLVQNNDSQAIVQFIDVNDSKNSLDIESSVDQVIIGAPVYAGKFPKKLIYWVHRYRESLVGKTVSLFTVSLNAADRREKAIQMNAILLRRFIDAVRLEPKFVASFAGGLQYTKYGFFTKLVMKHISKSNAGPTDTKRDFELTNWREVENFAKAIQLADFASPFSVFNIPSVGPSSLSAHSVS